jgi:hypothetical protein
LKPVKGSASIDDTNSHRLHSSFRRSSCNPRQPELHPKRGAARLQLIKSATGRSAAIRLTPPFHRQSHAEHHAAAAALDGSQERL